MIKIHSLNAAPYDGRIGSREVMRTALMSLFLIFSIQSSKAQQGAVVSTATTAQKENKDSSANETSTAMADTRYRIGPGDVLEVRVLRAPELSRDGVRVDQRGMIRLPMLETDIQAACFTEGELAENIARLYLEYKLHPHVDVFVKEFQSQPAAVIGAVRGAAQFKLQRQVRLLELLSLAGGPAESAGQTIQIVHAAGSLPCEKPASTAVGETDGSAFVAYKLSDTLHGIPEANPFIRPGDIISVPDADQVYVVGNVIRPSAILMKEPLTVSRAIAMTGGTAPATKKDRVRIIRQVPGSTAKQEIYVDLTAIERNRAEDVALLANDVVDVPASAGKTILRSLVGAISPTVSNLPVRVIR
jgi:polysaccharide export outer membrane protein